MGDAKDISLHCVKIHKNVHMSELWHFSPQVQKRYDYVIQKRTTTRLKTTFCFQTGNKIVIGVSGFTGMFHGGNISI